MSNKFDERHKEFGEQDELQDVSDKHNELGKLDKLKRCVG